MVLGGKGQLLGKRVEAVADLYGLHNVDDWGNLGRPTLRKSMKAIKAPFVNLKITAMADHRYNYYQTAVSTGTRVLWGFS